MPALRPVQSTLERAERDSRVKRRRVAPYVSTDLETRSLECRRYHTVSMATVRRVDLAELGKLREHLNAAAKCDGMATSCPSYPIKRRLSFGHTASGGSSSSSDTLRPQSPAELRESAGLLRRFNSWAIGEVPQPRRWILTMLAFIPAYTKALLVIQAAGRRRLAVKCQAAMRLQRAWHNFVARLEALDKLHGLRRVKTLHSLIARSETRAASAIQRCFREWLAVKCRAAIKLQSAWRGWQARLETLFELHELERMNALQLLIARGETRATTTIQRCFRLHRAKLSAAQRQRELSVTCIQNRARGMAARKLRRQMREQRIAALCETEYQAAVERAIARGMHIAAAIMQQAFRRLQIARFERQQAEEAEHLAATEAAMQVQRASDYKRLIEARRSTESKIYTELQRRDSIEREAQESQKRASLMQPVGKRIAGRLGYSEKWQPHVLSLDATGEVLEWHPCKPDGVSTERQEKESQSVLLSTMQYISISKALLTFTVTADMQMHEFRATSPDAFSAWVEALMPLCARSSEATDGAERSASARASHERLMRAAAAAVAAAAVQQLAVQALDADEMVAIATELDAASDSHLADAAELLVTGRPKVHATQSGRPALRGLLRGAAAALTPSTLQRAKTAHAAPYVDALASPLTEQVEPTRVVVRPMSPARAIMKAMRPGTPTLVPSSSRVEDTGAGVFAGIPGGSANSADPDRPRALQRASTEISFEHLEKLKTQVAQQQDTSRLRHLDAKVAELDREYQRRKGTSPPSAVRVSPTSTVPSPLESIP